MSMTEILPLIFGAGACGFLAMAFAEKFIPIVPSYVMLMMIGLNASSARSLLLSLLATVTGSLLASAAWYSVGIALGERRVQGAVNRFGKFIFLPRSTYDRLAAAYRGNLFAVSAIGQVIPVARLYLALPAGVLRLDPVVFSTAALVGIVAWNAPFLTLGYLLRGTGYDVSEIGFWASIALIAAEFVILAVIRTISRMKQQRPIGALQSGKQTPA